jgi:hypothetical protein
MQFGVAESNRSRMQEGDEFALMQRDYSGLFGAVQLGNGYGLRR